MTSELKDRFKTLSSIEKYNLLSKIRDKLKSVQKLSWKITQMERKFPLEQLEEKSYEALLGVYSDYIKELKTLADDSAAV